MPSLPVHPDSTKAYVEIIEQPASHSLRFRYECEMGGRSPGSIVGVRNTSEVRTFPTIKVMNYVGPYAVVVSCVSKDGPFYRPHPHNLVDRENCTGGVCSMFVNNPDMTCSFTSLGIQCVKKKDIEKSLKTREAHKLDPFGTGFRFSDSFDLSTVRLCFQVFIPGPDKCFSFPLQPVVSDPIYDKKAMFTLKIISLSHKSALVTGGTKIILLCDRVANDDIEIWFYEERGSSVMWEARAEFQPSDVHKHVAITFKTPRYYNEKVKHVVQVFVELRKPSENTKSEPHPFVYLPIERDFEECPCKKIKSAGINTYDQSDAFAGFSSQEHLLPFNISQLLKLSTHQETKVESTKRSQSVIVTRANDSWLQSFTLPNLKTASVPVIVPSASAHLTSLILKGAPGQAAITPKLDTFEPPISQKILKQSPRPVKTETRDAEEESNINQDKNE